MDLGHNNPRLPFPPALANHFLPLLPQIYADLFRTRLDKYGGYVWLINTGWTAGGFHTGYRMPLPHTRAMINWVLSGEGLTADYHSDPVFGLNVPKTIPGIPQELLVPRNTWNNTQGFDKAAEKLKSDFDANYRNIC